MGAISRGRRLGGALLVAAVMLPLLPFRQEGALAKEELNVDTFTVADRKGDQTHARISGNLVVWQDYRDIASPSGEDYNADVYARNLDNGDEFTVTDNHTASSPDVSGDLIVYADGRNGDADIRAYNARRDETFWVVRKAGSTQDRPAVDGSIVVWQDNRDGNWDIRGKNVATDDEFWVSHRDDNQRFPRIDGRLVVWEDDRDGCCDVYVKDLDSGDVTRITESHDARFPDIAGKWVVYRRGDNDRADIYAYNLDTGDATRLNGSRSDSRGRPSVSGGIAAWADRRNGDDNNVYVYDLQKGNEYAAIRASEDQLEPSVSGMRLVYTDLRGDRGAQIKGATLTLPAQATPTPTTAPTSSVPAPPVGQPVPAGPCYFTLGFKALRDMIPQIVGDCRENEWHNAFNGDALQQTSGGLLVWRKADNWTAFTNGSVTWLNGPCGLQTRPNEGPFYAWEGRSGAPCS